MQKGVNAANLKSHAATANDIPPEKRVGKVALVLGAGNIAAISPLDAFQKLFIENQVVLLKMNPVDDYLTEYLEAALKPLIDVNALRIHRGDGASGAYLTEHPGAANRQSEFAEHADGETSITRGAGVPPCLMADMAKGDVDWLADNEVFAPAFATKELPANDPEAYLRAAIAWANDTLYGTLGGNILIHPRTIRKIGRKRFEEILAEFRYGTIAVNAWTGLGFLLAPVPGVGSQALTCRTSNRGSEPFTTATYWKRPNAP